jgi:hypothetical protein
MTLFLLLRREKQLAGITKIRVITAPKATIKKIRA